MAPAVRQRLYLHVGLPKTGTTWLQSLLRRHRDELAEQGIACPFVGEEEMFHAALETAGRPRRYGVSREEIAGTFETVVAEGRRSGLTVVVSHEIFASASRDQVRGISERLAEFEVHLVLTVRDPGSLLVAEWQERVKSGRASSFAEHAERRFPSDALTGQEAGWEAHVRRADLRRIGGLLARWEPFVPSDRIHVVVCPSAGQERSLLWDRYADAIGVDPGVVDVAPGSGRAVRPNTSLGAEQIAFLRRVVDALDGRLTQPAYAHVAKRWFAQVVLAAQPGTRPGLPERYAAPLDWLARQWMADIETSGAVVHGDLQELRVRGTGSSQDPDDVPAEQVAVVGAAAVAEMLLEVRDLRREVRRLRRQVRRLGGSAATPARSAAGRDARSRARRAAGRWLSGRTRS